MEYANLKRLQKIIVRACQKDPELVKYLRWLLSLQKA